MRGRTTSIDRIDAPDERGSSPRASSAGNGAWNRGYYGYFVYAVKTA